MAGKLFSRCSGAHLVALALAALLNPSNARAQQAPPNIPVAPSPPSPASPSSAAAAAQAYGDPTPPATPLSPFSATMTVLNSARSVGMGVGQLNVTSLIVTNFDSSPQQVYIFAPTFASGGKCGDTVTGGSYPNFSVYVQPSQTLVMPFPTPLVVKGLTPNCLGAEVTTLLHGGSAQVVVTGYYQRAR